MVFPDGTIYKHSRYDLTFDGTREVINYYLTICLVVRRPRCRPLVTPSKSKGSVAEISLQLYLLSQVENYTNVPYSVT